MNVLLQQNDKGDWVIAVDFKTGKRVGELTQVHAESACRSAAGCAIHDRPSHHPLKDAPRLWDDSKGILERACTHGIAHPDVDSAAYLERIGNETLNVHTCDGCCVVQSVSVEQDYYAWRSANVGKELSLKDAFLAGRGE